MKRLPEMPSLLEFGGSLLQQTLHENTVDILKKCELNSKPGDKLLQFLFVITNIAFY